MLEIDRLRSKILELENEKTSRVFSKKQLDFKNYPCEKASDRTVSDLTSLENCVQNIGGIAAKTASPTDIYVLNMKPNFKYDSEHIPKIYMKLFLSGTDQENVKIRNPLLDEELLYEYMIYLTKIKDIVGLKRCKIQNSLWRNFWWLEKFNKHCETLHDSLNHFIPDIF